MANDLIEIIRKAEDDAEKILIDGKADSENIVKEAYATANRLHDEASVKAAEYEKSVINTAQIKAAVVKADSEDMAQQKKQELSKLAETKRQETVKKLAEMLI